MLSPMHYYFQNSFQKFAADAAVIGGLSVRRNNNNQKKKKKTGGTRLLAPIDAQSRGDLINIQQVGCLCPLFLALFHCAGDGVGGDLST